MKTIVLFYVGIVTLLVSLVFIAYYNESFFLFIFGILLAILGLYSLFISLSLGINRILKPLRRKILKKQGWDIDNIQKYIIKNQFIIHKIDPNGIEGKPTVIKSIIVDKNFIFISDFP